MGEFVELGYLREYRRKDVPLQRLRPVIQELRRVLGTPYPLATAKPYVFDKELVLDVQERTGVPSSIAIVICSGQEIMIMITPETNRFFKKVEFDPCVSASALRIRPPVLRHPWSSIPSCDSAQPAVAGVATERLWELYDAGETLDTIADGHDLHVDAVRAAVAYEEQFRSSAA